MFYSFCINCLFFFYYFPFILDESSNKVEAVQPANRPSSSSSSSDSSSSSSSDSSSSDSSDSEAG